MSCTYLISSNEGPNRKCKIHKGDDSVSFDYISQCENCENMYCFVYFLNHTIHDKKKKNNKRPQTCQVHSVYEYENFILDCSKTLFF